MACHYDTAMNPFDPRRLSPAYWFVDATEPIEHPAYLALAVLLMVGLVASVYVRIMADQMFDGKRYQQRQAARMAGVALFVCVAGLVVLLFRWQPVPFLSKRIWLYLWLMAAVAAMAYGLYFYRRVYPVRLREYLEEDRRRRYLPRPGATVRLRRRKGRRR